jgi:hypothetical protein
MAGLVCTVSRRQIMPRRARAQDPQHAIHYPAGIAPSTTAPIGALSPLLVPIHERPDVFPLRIGEISHASHLLQLRSCRKCLFRRDVDEIASQFSVLSSQNWTFGARLGYMALQSRTQNLADVTRKSLAGLLAGPKTGIANSHGRLEMPSAKCRWLNAEY